MGAGVLFRDSSGRVLLVEPTYKPYWEIPGGVVEADESPFDAACREVKEELGLVVSPGRLLVVDWVPPRPDRTEGLMLVYDGGTLGAEHAAAIRVPAEELHRWAFCSMDEAVGRLSDLLFRRVTEALRACDGATAYLEYGHPRV